MQSGTLMLHAGSQAVDRQALLDVRTPDATKSFVPIPHDVLLNEVVAALIEAGLMVVAERHGLGREGAEYFGILDVEKRGNGDDVADKGYIRTVGIRNAHNKRFPAIVGAGSRVFVCDNLAFSAEIQISRRHTTHLFRDLPQLVIRAIGMLASKWIDQDTRFDAYKRHELNDAEVHDVLIRSLDFRVIGLSHLPRVLAAYRKPEHAEFEARTLWSLFNAYTEVFKDTNLFAMPKRTTALHGLFDQRAGLVIDTTAERVALEEEEGVDINIRG